MDTTTITRDSVIEGKSAENVVDLSEEQLRLQQLTLQFEEDKARQTSLHETLWQRQVGLREHAVKFKVFRFAPVGFKKSVYDCSDPVCTVPINVSPNSDTVRSLVKSWNSEGPRKTREDLKTVTDIRQEMIHCLLEMISCRWFETDVTPRSFQYVVQKFKSTGKIVYPTANCAPVTRRRNWIGKHFLRVLQTFLSPVCFDNKAIKCLMESLSTNVTFVQAHGKTTHDDVPAILRMVNANRKFPINAADLLLLTEAYDGIRQLFFLSGKSIYQQSHIFVNCEL